jgi:hypothetical protein
MSLPTLLTFVGVLATLRLTGLVLDAWRAAGG